MYSITCHSIQKPLSGYPSLTRSKSNRNRSVRVFSNDPQRSQDQGPVLQAFFIGRALAEIVNERAGVALENLLAEVGKSAAELTKSLEQLPAEVVARAEKEMAESLEQGGGNQPSLLSSSSSGGGRRRSKLSSSTISSSKGSMESHVDINQAVDDLRAEVAAARASARLVLQSTKDKK